MSETYSRTAYEITTKGLCNYGPDGSIGFSGKDGEAVLCMEVNGIDTHEATILGKNNITAFIRRVRMFLDEVENDLKRGDMA